MDINPTAASNLLSDAEIVQYRQDGYVVVRNLLGLKTIEACKQALADLATGKLPARETSLMFETGHENPPAESRELFIRKYMDFTEDAPALKAAANSARLHQILDQLLGQGRLLFQEMALVKPPRIGSEKPWHQDAAYFRLTDPALIAGVWIALDPALPMNGCMELVPGTHLEGGVPHVHENDFNRCRIIPGRVRVAQRIPISMQPGDALIFHALLHHFTAPNKSDLLRRAIQFHYHQLGAIWGDVETHRAHFHTDDGSYAGCTVPHGEAAQANYAYREGLPRRITPVDTSS
jgi:phytanoyl-CoA hydroxylase